jgi:hypothetical protein
MVEQRTLEDLAAERESVKQTVESERRRRDLATSTVQIERGRQARIEQFVQDNEISAYPVDDADLKDENREFDMEEASLFDCVRLQVERALERAETKPPVLAPTLASWLLKSIDVQSGALLANVPPERVTPARLLAHVATLGVWIEPKLAASIARRLSMVLMNHPDRTQKAKKKKETMCFECGAAHGDHAAGCSRAVSGSLRHGRKVVGYVKSRTEMMFGSETMSAGTVTEKLAPTEKDKSDMAYRKSALTIVWWKDKVRFVDSHLLTSARKDDYDAALSLAKEQKPC